MTTPNFIGSHQSMDLNTITLIASPFFKHQVINEPINTQYYSCKYARESHCRKWLQSQGHQSRDWVNYLPWAQLIYIPYWPWAWLFLLDSIRTICIVCNWYHSYSINFCSVLKLSWNSNSWCNTVTLHVQKARVGKVKPP